MEMFLVGGAVRDMLLGIESKDWDFSVIAPSFEDIETWLIDNGFTIFLSTPQFFTIRARGPKDFEFAGHQVGNQTFDFVWARREGDYSDGRHPDWVRPGSLLDDLQRRDFTVNAMAMDEAGEIIDPFGGQEDLRRRVIKAVGVPGDRFKEDALRIIRAVRFSVTKNMDIDPATNTAMWEWRGGLGDTSAERIREELHKMFMSDTSSSLLAIIDHPWLIAIMRHHNIRLKPTMEK